MGGSEPTGGRRYVFDVGPGDSGMRITLRRRLPEGGLGDVLGQLLSWQDGVVTLRRRDDVVVTVQEADVVAAKRIGPPPVPR